MVWFWFICVFVVILIVLLLSRIYIACHYTYKQGSQRLLVCVYFFRMRILKKDIDMENQTGLEIWKGFQGKDLVEIINYTHFLVTDTLHKISEMNALATILLKKIQFRKIHWKTHIGTGDASSTGMTAGGVWSVKGLILGIISNKSKINCTPELAVSPLFQHTYMYSKLDCMVSIRVGQAILALLKVIRKVPAKEKASILKEDH